jgi:uncharacterized membrane protein (UPF0182 family)
MSTTAIDSTPAQPKETRGTEQVLLSPSAGHRLRWGLFVVFAVAILITVILGLVQKWLWMRELNYTGIFWTLLSVKWAMFGAAAVGAFLFLWMNLRIAARAVVDLLKHSAASRETLLPEDNARRFNIDLSSRFVLFALDVAAMVVSVVFAISISAQWDTYLRFRYGGSFGVVDPLFKVDLGFYFFRLPFYELLQGALVFLAVAALAIVCGVVLLELQQSVQQKTFKIRPATARHLAALLFVLSATFGWGFYLDHYELVYSTLGVVYGAGFAAAHVTMVVLWGMVGASVLACGLIALTAFRPRARWLAIGIGVYAVFYAVGVLALPRLVEAFVVQPSELSRETPYLKNYIEFTRDAYKLNVIQETAYPALTDLTPEVIARNQDTVQNIRLWDSRPLLQTYQQTQAIRLYYQFYNVDTDRYHLSDGYHQVMLASRELASELPAQAQTWVNENLQFTHGYGLVMNSVSKTTGGGFPQYLIKDIPPLSSYQSLNAVQPAIYYGEVSPGYKIVSTSIKEFDYPKGNENVYNSYQGSGGIPLDGIWKRLLFAWTQKDINILFTSYLTPQSRIQLWRSVQERISQIAPFLLLDKDPYAVVSDGRLYWIQDAYTVSDRYPYSQPQTSGTADGSNYIRNSVKIVVDMYDGAVSFYIMDPKDPVLGVYRKAFPGVFKDLSELSADLKLHLRYPQDLFAIQAAEYSTFHMTDPQVFYNREDLWVAPQEKFDGAVNPMEPYYILMKLPGSTQLEYLIMTPFTPQKRDNMIAWLAARCDFPDYGRMLFYELPKEKLIYGPNQISAMIDQSTLISEQLTLWDQKGSSVIRGKLIVIPIENSFLYVVPLYLKAEGTSFPQLKRVIAAAGDRVVMEPSLDGALSDLFANPSGPAGMQPAGKQQPALPKSTLDQVRAELAQAQKAMDSARSLLANPAP